MLRYYLTVILGGPAVIALISFAIMHGSEGFSLGYLLFAAYSTTALAFGIDALAAILTRKLARGRAVDPFARFYTVSKGEKKLQKFLRVKSWKDKIPEMGGLLVGFQKKKVEKDSPEYLYFFLKETCYAELMHIISAFAGFLIIFAFSLRYALFVTLPVALVNFILNIMPVIVQRYVRPLMISMYKRSLRKAEKTEKETVLSEK